MSVTTLIVKFFRAYSCGCTDSRHYIVRLRESSRPAESADESIIIYGAGSLEMVFVPEICPHVFGSPPVAPGTRVARRLNVTPVHVGHVPHDGRGRGQEVPPRAIGRSRVRRADERCRGRRCSCGRRRRGRRRVGGRHVGGARRRLR